MEVKVRKGKVAKALAVLNRKLAEDGDLARIAERNRGFKTKGEKRREALKRAIKRRNKEEMERAKYDQ
jgi:hypothetical protein